MASPDAFNEAIEADELDADSAIGDDASTVDSTASLSDSILAFRHENGRTYHAYKDGKYLSPNDAKEIERLDVQHHIFIMTYGNKLLLSPIEGSKIKRVLDVGTGTGIWAIDFADEHPDAAVIGIDLSPIQPPFTPPNCQFQVDDLEQEWTFRPEDKFDLIHSRMMTASFQDWPAFFRKCFENLNPGGFLEVTDIAFPVATDDDSFPKDSALKKWSDLIVSGTSMIGRPINSAVRYKQQLEEAGFVDIREHKFKWPQNRWPKDPKMKEIGAWNLANGVDNVDGICMALFTRVLGWAREEVEVFLVDVRKEMKDVRIHSYWPVFAYSARKPESNASNDDA